MLQQIAKLGEDGTFGPEEVRVLVGAFDAAWGSVMSSGAPFSQPPYRELAREILAKAIIQAAKGGERDERKLCDAALLTLSRANLRRSPNAH